MPHQDELKPCLDRLNMDMMSEEECKLREVTAMLAEQNGRIPAASGR